MSFRFTERNKAASHMAYEQREDRTAKLVEETFANIVHQQLSEMT